MIPRILFVDDDRALLDGIRRSLREPWDCLFAEDFEQALTHLESGRIDVLVCDERFPGRSGWELLAEVRRAQPRIMRLMLTGEASTTSAVAGINHGQLFRLLLKPCPHDALVEAITAALERQAIDDRLRTALTWLVRTNTALAAIAEREPAAYRAALAAVGASAEGPGDARAVLREMDECVAALGPALGS